MTAKSRLETRIARLGEKVKSLGELPESLGRGKSLGELPESPGKDIGASCLVNEGIGEGGSLNNSDNQDSIQGVGCQGEKILGSPYFRDSLGDSLEEHGLDVGGGGGGTPSARFESTTRVHTRKKVGIASKYQDTRDARKKAVSLALVAALRKAGYGELGGIANEIELCRSRFITYHCGYCNTDFGLPISCHQRLCPQCGSARAMDIWERHKDKLLRARKPKHLTLTFRSEKHLSATYIRWAFGCWTRLIHRKSFSRAIFGALVAFEATYGVEGWHPHLHCFIDADYLPKEQIEAAWKEITQGSYVCRIRKVYGGWQKGVKEVVKYPSKVVTFYQEPELLREFIEATEGVHLIRGYGSFYRIRQRYHLKRGEVECPVCGEQGYLEIIGNHEPIVKFTRKEWGWLYKAGDS